MESGWGSGCGCLLTILLFGFISRSIFGGGGFWIGSGTSFSPPVYIDTERLREPPMVPFKRKRKLVIPPPSAPKPYEGDKSFVDEALDQLIADGRYTKARAHVKGMIEIAREMNNKKMIANYRMYSKRILEACQGT